MVEREEENPVFLTIQEALDFAVQNGNMSIEEAEDCLDAYVNTFNTLIEKDPPITDGSST